MATNYKFITTDNLTQYSKLVKTSINAAKTAADNAQTTANGAMTEAQKKEVLPFNGIVAGVTLTQTSVSNVDAIFYDSTKNTFLGAVNTTPLQQKPTYQYHNNWGTREQYTANVEAVPFTNKIYVNLDTNENYYFNGSEMVCLGIKKGSLATINGQSLEDGGDIELDFTVAEFVTALPALSAASKSKIYLVPSSTSGANNSYKEYIKVTVSGTDKWEALGEYKTEADLTPYLKKTDAASTYVAKESGKGLSTNDYTSAEKTKLSGIEEGANKYVLPVATASTLGGVKVVAPYGGADTASQKELGARAIAIDSDGTLYLRTSASSAYPGIIGVYYGGNEARGANNTFGLRCDTSDFANGYVRIPAVTTSADGLMSAADKKTFDNLGSTYVAQSSIDSVTDSEITTLWNNA